MATDNMKLYPKGTWIRVKDTALASDNHGMIGKILFVYDGWHDDGVEHALYKVAFPAEDWVDAEFHYDVDPIDEEEVFFYRLSN